VRSVTNSEKIRLCLTNSYPAILVVQPMTTATLQNTLVDGGKWPWLMTNDGGMVARIAIGVGIFAVLAWVDYARHGRAATRWREYAFLVGTVVVALVYGIVNDLVTSTISWEYFYYGKGLWEKIGDGMTPVGGRLQWEAVKIGMKATWTAGLLVGAVVLIANNLSQRKPGLRQLTYRELWRGLAIVPGICVVGAVVLGLVGTQGWLAWTLEDFGQMVQKNEMRPYRFMGVFGIHLGGYVGGLVGTAWAAIWVKKKKGCKSQQRVIASEVPDNRTVNVK